MAVGLVIYSKVRSFKAKTKTKAKSSRPRPRLWNLALRPRPKPRINIPVGMAHELTSDRAVSPATHMQNPQVE